MFATLTDSDRRLAIQRLTALWALNECGLGGVLHAFNSPFTGLLVGSLAMVCIAFICALSEQKWKTVMTSLLLVLVIKALVSPHSSPTAYLAVTFQAVTGALIYRFIPYLSIASVLFVTLGLIESALQRLLTLTILYGNTLWDAINIWGEWVTERWGVLMPVSSASLIIWTYLTIHLAAGVLIGWSVYKSLKAVSSEWGKGQYQLVLTETDTRTFFKVRKKNKWRRYVFFLALIAMIVFAYSGVPDPESNIQQGLIAVMRAFAILTLWYVFLAPALIRWLQGYLSKKHKQLSIEVAQTMEMFPRFLWIIDRVRTESSGLRSLRRLKYIVVHSLLYILQYRTHDDTDSNGTSQKS